MQGQVEILTCFLRMLSCQRDAPGYIENGLLRAAEPTEQIWWRGMLQNSVAAGEFAFFHFI